jgi:hypothetical protein
MGWEMFATPPNLPQDNSSAKVHSLHFLALLALFC